MGCTPSSNGVISKQSDKSVAETVEGLVLMLQAKKIALFARVDHSAEAAKVGLQLRPTTLLIFGNPAGGTPLMQAAQLSALDLPLKLLVWEDLDGKTWISYNSPDYLQKRYNLPLELVKNIAIIETLVNS